MSNSSYGNQEDRTALSMLCPIILSFLPLLALGELRPRLEHAVRDHLDNCESCRSELEHYEVISRWLHVQLSGKKRHTKHRAPVLTLERLLIGDDADYASSSAVIEALLLASASGNGDSVDYARIRSHAFRLAFGEALAGRKTTTLPSASIRNTALNASLPNIAPQCSESNLSEAFATGVRRSLAAVAQHWFASEIQPLNGSPEPC
jgi:putative zinc finger protein